LTNKQFATAIGCHFTTASRYRNGHRLPQVELLERMRKVLGVSHDEIYDVWSKGRRYKSRHGTDRPERNPFGIYLRRHIFTDDDDLAA
jgi:transcriptional regulator with XRE-family HTH domain